MFEIEIHQIRREPSPVVEPPPSPSELGPLVEPELEDIDSDGDLEQLEELWMPFNPGNIKIAPLKNFKVSQTFGSVTMTQEEMSQLLNAKAEQWSKNHVDIHKMEMEAWVQDMEQLAPIIPLCCTSVTEPSEAIRETLLYWAEIGVDLSLLELKTELSAAFKVRYINVGIKLIHALALASEKVVKELLNHKVDRESEDEGKTFQEKLIVLFEEKCMRIKTRLWILRALDCLLLSKEGFLKFVGDKDDDNSCFESFGRLLEFIINNELGARVSFSVQSLLKKVRLLQDLATFECFALKLVEESSPTFSASVTLEDADACVDILESFRNIAKNVHQYLCHPLKLKVLPREVVQKLRQTSMPGHDPEISFIKALEQHHFIKLCIVIVNNKDLCRRTGDLISEIISILLEWEPGLVYLCSESEATTTLLKTLAHLDNGGNGVPLRACYCMEVMKCIDQLSDSPTPEGQTVKQKNLDLLSLQTLSSFMYNDLGRQSLLSILPIRDFSRPLLRCLMPTEDCKFGKLTQTEQNVRKGYASTIIEFIVKNEEKMDFLMKHGTTLNNIISVTKDDAVGVASLPDLIHFLRCALNPLTYDLDGIDELLRIVKSTQGILLRYKTAGANWGYPPELITALRLLCSQAVPSSSNDNCISADGDDPLIKEMKCDTVLLKIFSLGAGPTFIDILQKIIDDFNGQSSTQRYRFVTSGGDMLINLLSPMLRMLRSVVTRNAHAMKTEYEDTAPIPVLLRVSTIIDSVPWNAPCYRRSREVWNDILGTLLAYTIPALEEGLESEELINKNTWTVMIREMIEFTMEDPAAFRAGLSLFSEMLPYPLPIETRAPLTEDECQKHVKLRKLWSTYLHGLLPKIKEMIIVMCSSSDCRLIAILQRVCVQLADLSASNNTEVCSAILEAVRSAIQKDRQPEQQIKLVCEQQFNSRPAYSAFFKPNPDLPKQPQFLISSPATSNILAFLSFLVKTYGTIKTGIVHALQGVRKDETHLMTFLCAILKTSSAQIPNLSSLSSIEKEKLSIHMQAQEHIVTILQSLCDRNINMLTPMHGTTGKIYDTKFVLANSVPPKALLAFCCNALLGYVSFIPHKPSTSRVMEAALTGLRQISETDVGFYHMRHCMQSGRKVLKNIVASLGNIKIKPSPKFDRLWSSITLTVQLLHSLASSGGATGVRTLGALTKKELQNAVDWPGGFPQDKDSVPSYPTHPLAKLSTELKNFSAKLIEDSVLPTTELELAIEVTEVYTLCDMLVPVFQLLEQDEESAEEMPPAPVIPSLAKLDKLYQKRPVFMCVEPSNITYL